MKLELNNMTRILTLLYKVTIQFIYVVQPLNNHHQHTRPPACYGPHPTRARQLLPNISQYRRRKMMLQVAFPRSSYPCARGCKLHPVYLSLWSIHLLIHLYISSKNINAQFHAFNGKGAYL